jgi:clan AA aspartic protease (TIGR02281 family)
MGVRVTKIVTLLICALRVSATHLADAESIALTQQGGTFIVPVLINDKITLTFTIDSGATDVSIPIDVFSTLIRTGTISSTDLLKPISYELADGSRHQEQRFRIRSLRIGNVELRNVVASVAPAAGLLLLGQSFLSRLQSWSIDNQRQVLVINELSGTGNNSGTAQAETIAPSSPVPAVVDAPKDIAEYHGSYVCPQGTTDLSLRILGTLSGSNKYAVFSFGPLPSNPAVPSGSFSVTGHIDITGGGMDLSPAEWIARPPGYNMVGLKGSSNDGGQSFNGYVVGPDECRGFFLTKVR